MDAQEIAGRGRMRRRFAVAVKRDADLTAWWPTGADTPSSRAGELAWINVHAGRWSGP